jgi:hypothetical protein
MQDQNTSKSILEERGHGIDFFTGSNNDEKLNDTYVLLRPKCGLWQKNKIKIYFLSKYKTSQVYIYTFPSS